MEKNPRRTAVNGAFCGCSSSRIGAAEKGEYMAYCENCGAPLSENVRFCGMCGAPVNMGAEAKKYCSNCHAELDPGAVFCAECGYQVIGEAAGPFLYSNTKSSQYTGAYNRYLLIYEDRLELRDCRKKQKLEPVILYMRDIGLVQAEASGLIRYGCITLVMKNGERRFLFIAYRSKKGNQQIQEAVSLIRSLLL